MRTVHYSSDPTHMPETALDHGEPAPPNTNLDILINAISANPTPAEPRPHGQLSIQSLLAASQQLASPPMPVDQQQQWASADPNRPQVTLGKRKIDDVSSDPEESRSKIRRTVRDHIIMDSARVLSMTTVVCLHAAVAQKSYGSEKRFLCPPPVVRIEGPTFANMRRQQLSMCIVSEMGDRSPEQKSTLDDNLHASFKYLHVAGTAKTKSFHLSLDIADANPSDTDSPVNYQPSIGRPWASFDSAPVTIISKPSKKTAKTRNISSCILAGGPVSLFNRINSQTVRTKYMTVDQNQLSASNQSWCAFNVNLIRRPGEPPLVGEDPTSTAFRTNHMGPQPVTYGSAIMLTDPETGVSSGPLVIRKVDKGKVAAEDGGPVSQMQKIALQRVNVDGSRWYLSAAAHSDHTAATPSISTMAPHALHFQAPVLREEVAGGNRIVIDEVDDYLCWTIVGISKFQYTFFDALGPGVTAPEMPITPFPTLYTTPVYRPASNTIELTVSNFFYTNPDPSDTSSNGTTATTHVPLEVWLGNLGPLRQRIYQANPPPPVVPRPNTSPTGSPALGSPGYLTAGGPLQTIVVVEMPPVSDIVRTLQEMAAPHMRMMAPPQSAEGNESEHRNEQEHEDNGSPPTESNTAAAIASALAAAANSSQTQNGTPPEGGFGGQAANGGGAPDANGQAQAPPALIAGQCLPILFIRSYDGTGYHSGRSIACENIFSTMGLPNLMGANGLPGSVPGAPGWNGGAPDGSDRGMHGWTLRVI